MANRSKLEEFTEIERDKINKMILNDFEGAAKEDIELYAEWQAVVAVNDAIAQAKMDAIKKESDVRIELARATQEAAQRNLEAQAALAEERLRLVRNGKTEQK